MEVLKKIPVLIFVIIQFAFVLSLKDTKDNTNRLCKEPKCIMKCCPLGKYLAIKRMDRKIKRICDYFDNSTRDFPVFVKDVSAANPGIKNNIFTVKDGIFEENETFKTKASNILPIPELPKFNLYVTDIPEVHLEIPNAYRRLIRMQNDKFCWDYKIDNSKTKIVAGIWAVLEENEEGPSRTNTALMTTAMFVSCFFLLVVLVVYSVLPELRNLGGQILMAYVGSLFCAFLLLTTVRVKPPDSQICPGLTYTIYYFFMASFCWMHVMSFDIWWTFRGFVKARSIHRRGEYCKLLIYCLYAFGLPLAMTIALVVVNNVDMTHVPWFVTPKIPGNACFLEGGEKFLYLYIPMLILIICNWMFYLMTAFNVWRLSRGTAMLDADTAGTPHAHRRQRHRLMVYVKLSAVMGLNWLLEVVSALLPGYNVWLISDLFNMLIGFTIFLIFVCKENILRKLRKRYINCKTKWQFRQKAPTRNDSSSLDCSSSHESQTLHVCTNPKGPGISMKTITNISLK